MAFGKDNGRSKSVIPESIRHEPLEPELPYERRQHYEAPPEALRQLEMQLSKTPLDQITDEILTLTYSEMMELVKDIRTADAQNLIPESLNLADVLHAMALTRNQSKRGGNNGQERGDDA
jgi:hypothetical protein